MSRPSIWIQVLESGRKDRLLSGIYGSNPDLISERKAALIKLLGSFRARYGDDGQVVIVRCPCRVNLMGMHVEHRGGYVNYVTHSREILLAAAASDGDLARMNDVRSQDFPERSFSIAEELSQGDRSSWMSYIESPGVVRRVSESQGDWSNYVKGIVLRLQARFADASLHGMEMMFSGNIPKSSGLSSSSAMVVSSALATLALNHIDLDRAELVALCGEAEWYVGTRGGAGDHAAMLFCKRGSICHLRFFPFQVEGYLPIPDGYSLAICDSMKRAHKAGADLDAYNQTIAAYNMVLILAKEAMGDLGLPPGLIEGTKHLRDINPLRLKLPDIYRLLRALPERASRQQLGDRLPGRGDELERIFRTHKEPAEGYRIRAVAMFGISECERGRIFAEILKSGHVGALGGLMFKEHDGDRVTRFDRRSGTWVRWDNEVSDELLDRLVADSSSGDLSRVAASALHLQPGGLGCSSPELDEMVEIARSVPGVLGAGLTGAGFGGCIRVLLKSTSVQDLIQRMGKLYYKPRGLPQGAELVQTVAGASVLGDPPWLRPNPRPTRLS